MSSASDKLGLRLNQSLPSKNSRLGYLGTTGQVAGFMDDTGKWVGLDADPDRLTAITSNGRLEGYLDPEGKFTRAAVDPFQPPVGMTDSEIYSAVKQEMLRSASGASQIEYLEQRRVPIYFRPGVAGGYFGNERASSILLGRDQPILQIALALSHEAEHAKQYEKTPTGLTPQVMAHNEVPAYQASAKFIQEWSDAVSIDPAGLDLGWLMTNYFAARAAARDAHAAAEPDAELEELERVADEAGLKSLERDVNQSEGRFFGDPQPSTYLDYYRNATWPAASQLQEMIDSSLRASALMELRQTPSGKRLAELVDKYSALIRFSDTADDPWKGVVSRNQSMPQIAAGLAASAAFHQEPFSLQVPRSTPGGAEQLINAQVEARLAAYDFIREWEKARGIGDQYLLEGEKEFVEAYRRGAAAYRAAHPGAANDDPGVIQAGRAAGRAFIRESLQPSVS